jgi:putative membrane protein
MRFANLTTLVSVAAIMLWLTLASGVACAADSQSLTPEEQAFLNRAMTDDASQIAMAQMALKKSSNPKVIALANTIIQERTALDGQLAQVMTTNDIQNKTKPVANNADTLTALQSLNGDAFDKTFAGLLVRDHYHIISAYEDMKANCTHPGLHDLAHNAVEALQGNLTEALDVLRSENWRPSANPNALTAAVDSHGSKVPMYWESISIVAAPW